MRSTNWQKSSYGIGGKYSELFPIKSERLAFSKTPEFAEIQEIIGRKMEKEGEPAAKRFGGTIVVRLPESIHGALVKEAEAEGVSLNQLCLAKLAVELKAVV